MAYTFRVYFPYTSRLVHRVQYIINYSSMTIVKQDKTRKPERTSLHSFNLLWLMWAVCGGFFITNFILCNWLTILIKPVFEKPVDTAKVKAISSQFAFMLSIQSRMYLTEVLFTTALAPASGSK